MRRLFFSIIGALCVIMTSCSQFDKQVAPEISETGTLKMTVHAGAVGALRKETAINMKNLYIQLSSPGLPTVYDTLSLSGGSAERTERQTYSGLASRIKDQIVEWTLAVESRDQNGKVIHSGDTTFSISPLDTIDVEMSLAAQYSMLVTNFFPIQDSVEQCELKVDGTVKGNLSFAKQTRLGDTVSLNDDYLQASPMGVSHNIEMNVYGKLWGINTLLYMGDTTITVVSGQNGYYHIMLEYVGPDILHGTAKMSVTLGAVGTTIIDGSIPDVTHNAHLQNFDVDPAEPAYPQPAGVAAFVDNFATNQSTADYATVETNAVLRLLKGFSDYWTSGGNANKDINSSYATAYKNGKVVNSSVLSANITYVANIARSRTASQEEAAYLDDRRNQSYSIIAALGSLASFFYSGANATTTISAVAADATIYKYNDAGSGGGSTGSALGSVVNLVSVLRNSSASTTPAKNYFNYPRPWRFNNSSEMIEKSDTVDAGYFDANRTTALSFPVYMSDVLIVPTLKPVRGTSASTDGGFPSGHTNAGYITAYAMAYAIPERFQELITKASELGHNRIVAGMHSPLDVMGGRMMSTAISAAALNSPANSTAKTEAYTQARAWLESQTNTNDATFYDFVHNADSSNYSINKSNFTQRLTSGFQKIGTTGKEMVVPKGAEVLLETRFPYLSAGQRREVLRTTGIASGYPLLDDEEGWGRLNLFSAADGYGSFNGTIYVTMDSSQITTTHNGFYAKDTWRNNISGPGRLVKTGSGRLVLTGNNSYKGGTNIKGGVLEANSPTALGLSDVLVSTGKLEITTGTLNINGHIEISTTGTLHCNLRSGNQGLLSVSGSALLDGTLNVAFSSQPASGSTIELITSSNLTGTFSTVNFTGLSINPKVSYTSTSLQLIF